LEANITHTIKCTALSTSLKPEDVENNSNFKTLTLDAVSFFDLQVSGSAQAEVQWTYDGEKIKLVWSKAFMPGEERKIDLKYKVRDPVAGLFFSAKEEGARFCITDHETERCRYWLACVDYPAVRQTLEFEITTLKDYVVLANGKHISDEVTAGLKKSKWKLEQQCPSYLVCFAVGQYHEIIAPAGTMGNLDLPIKYYAPINYSKDDILRAYEKTPGLISWLSKKLGTPFHYPKYYQIAAYPVGGAMENISLVTWTDRVILNEKNHKEYGHWTLQTNVHELAHSWFGDTIGIRHFEHLWLKESWATYIETCYLEDNVSKEEFEYDLWINAESYFDETESYMRQMVQRQYQSSWSLFDSHTYPGGAWRIHMLRKLVGDALFWEGVKKYIATFREGTAETDDFRKAIESVTGLNLTRFFDEWYYSKGFPSLKVGYSYDIEKKNVRIKIEQTQVSKEKEIGLFHVPVDVRIVLQDGTVFDKTAKFGEDNDDGNITFLNFANIDKEPKLVLIDPNTRLLAKIDFNPGETLLKSIAVEAPDVANRIRAYNQLIKTGTPSSFAKAREGILAEKFHGVRYEVSKALEDNRSKLAVNLLADLLTNEKDDKITWRIASRCRIRDSYLRQALLKFLEKDNLGDRALENAISALGFQQNDEDFSLIYNLAKGTVPSSMKIRDIVGQHGSVRNGTLTALSYYEKDEVFDYLYEVVKKGENRKVMPVAVVSLARCALFREKQYQKKTSKLLVDILSSSSVFGDRERLKKAIISSLVVLQARESDAAIEASKPGMAKQDWFWVDAKLESLRKTTDSQDWKKRVEDLESKLRTIEEKLIAHKLNE
jgi:aminopeptidase N